MEYPFAETACLLSSVVLRVCSYVFLRWIPGHLFPQIVFTAFAVFISSFAYLYRNQKPYQELAKENDVTIVEKPTLGADAVASNALTSGEKLQILRELKADDPSSVSEEPHLELQATERVLVQRKQPRLLRTLLGGTPSPTSWRASLATALINGLLLLSVLDLTYRSSVFHPSEDLSFARPGYASDHSVRLLVREPNPNALPVGVYYREEDSNGIAVSDWKAAAEVIEVDKDTDFVSAVTITGLEPSKHYGYKTSTGHTGSVKTAPPHGSLFHTNVPRGKFTFLTSSCLKARVPYNPFDHPLSIKGLGYLGDLLEKGRKGLQDGIVADFMLFLGDFIYIDVPRRPRGDAREGYRMHYRQVYNSPEWNAAGNSLPWLHVIDDHEIANDWDANVTGIYSTALDPFHIYQHSVNPPPHRVGETYYTFKHGESAAFFLLDSRRYRSPSGLEDGPGKTFLGQHQLDDLIAWIKKDDGDMQGVQWKFVVTSSPFTKNWRFDATDTWGVYLNERQKVLEAMWSMGGKFGFVVLSGDRHEFGATAFPPPNGTVSNEATVYEFSCSPLSQFYLPKRTYKQLDNEDVMIKYIPDGNSKFGAVEVDSTNRGGQAVVKYRLFVDGKEVWDYTLTKDLVLKTPSSRELWD